MATVGQQLLQPEAGWRRIDDSNPFFVFSSGFVRNTVDANAYGGSYTVTSDPTTQTVRFKFRGSKLRIIGFKGSAYSDQLRVTIDDLPAAPMSEYSGSGQYQTLNFEKTGLEFREHCVLITRLDTARILIDAIDIDDNGELLDYNLAETTDLLNIKVGERIRAKYVAAANTFGTISNIGQTSGALISTTSVPSAPNGDFYFICTGYDHRGRKKLIADRPIQSGITYDTLNNVGLVTGIKINLGEQYNVANPILRLIDGSSRIWNDDNEWDKIVVKSTLKGNTIPGDNNTWNWNTGSNTNTWTSGTYADTIANRVVRGSTSASHINSSIASNSNAATIGFRPMLLVEEARYINKVSDVFFSKTYLTSEDTSVLLSFKPSIEDRQSGYVTGKYEVAVNGNMIETNPILAGNDITVDVNIPVEYLVDETNIIGIKVISADDSTTKITVHNIYKETVDTFSYVRNLDIDTSITKDASLTRVYTKGIGLDTIGTGQISIPIPTIRKGFMQSIVVVDDYNDLAVKYQVSTDGVTFKGWNGTAWDEAFFMNKTQINALNSSQLNQLFSEGANSVDFVIESTLTTEASGKFSYVKSVTVNYSPNQAPIFVNPVFAPDSIHAEFCTFTSNVKDYEGDSIECRVSIKKAGEADFYIADNWKPVSSGSIFRAYNQPYFNVGTNIIKIECKDQRGVISEWTSNLVMTNTRPTFIYSYNEFGFIGTIDDPEGDKVRLRITINNNVILDWTNHKTVPFQLKYEWDTSLINVGSTNIIKVDIEDTFKESITENISIMGQYKNILFEDENGDFYTNDKGEVLKTLDFGRLIVGDTNIPIFKLVMRNFTNYSINNIVLKANIPPELPEGTKILIGTSISPFNGVEELHLAEAMNHASTRDIFIQVKPETGRGIPQTTIDIIAIAAIVKS